MDHEPTNEAELAGDAPESAGNDVENEGEAASDVENA